MMAYASLRRIAAFVAALAIGLTATLPAQSARDAALRERAAYAEWLMTGATSPYAVLVQRPVGPGLTLGPAGAQIPLPGLSAVTVTERRGVPYLSVGGLDRPIGRFRPVPVEDYRLMVSGRAGRAMLTVYGPEARRAKPPVYHDYDPAFDLPVVLRPPARPATKRLLAADGLEVEAVDAGTVEARLEGSVTTLQVFRIPDPAGEESELEIYFRDLTNDLPPGEGTYPAGRFVSLIPLGGARYRLDLNRARNPFCAYNTAFACPLPWRGNSLPVAVTAGERYAGGGQDPAR